MSAAPCAARPTNRGTAIEMAVSGIIGLCASFVLSIEAWQLAADQGRTFSCDVSSVRRVLRSQPLRRLECWDSQMPFWGSFSRPLS